MDYTLKFPHYMLNYKNFKNKERKKKKKKGLKRRKFRFKLLQRWVEWKSLIPYFQIIYFLSPKFTGTDLFSLWILILYHFNFRIFKNKVVKMINNLLILYFYLKKIAKNWTTRYLPLIENRVKWVLFFYLFYSNFSIKKKLFILNQI